MIKVVRLAHINRGCNEPGSWWPTSFMSPLASGLTSQGKSFGEAAHDLIRGGLLPLLPLPLLLLAAFSSASTWLTTSGISASRNFNCAQAATLHQRSHADLQ